MSRLDNAIWFEKYRPTSLEEMSIPRDNYKIFSSFLKSKEIPHLLLYGLQGSGKTTTAQIFINKIGASTLSLNASKDRGIDTVRGKITAFAQSKQIRGGFKIVFLDEFDQMTDEAQKALKNTMEIYSGHCRFILTANCIDKVNAAIKSRCRLFSFEQLPKIQVLKNLQNILRRELIKVKKEELAIVVNKFYPDIRTTINELQSACVGGVFKLNRIKSLTVDMEKFNQLLEDGYLLKIRKLLVNTTQFTQLYRWLYDKFLTNHGTDEQKMDIVLSIAEYQNVDPITPDKEINFTACLVAIMQILEIKPKF